jgi:hypothetical protein
MMGVISHQNVNNGNLMKPVNLIRLITLWFVLLGILSVFINYSSAQTGVLITTTPAIRLETSDLAGVSFQYVGGIPDVTQTVVEGVPYSEVALAGAYLAEEQGKPGLPMYIAMIGIPYGVEPSLHYTAQTTQTLPLSAPVLPALSQLPAEEDLQPAKKAYLPSTEIYQSTNSFPDTQVVLSDTLQVRDQRVVVVKIFPVSYQPSESTLQWSAKIDIRIDFIGTAELSNPAVGEPEFEGMYQNLLNYDSAKAWRQSLAVQSLGAPANENESLLAVGTRYRIAVPQDGRVKLKGSQLTAVGASLTKTCAGNTAYPIHLTMQGQDVAYTVNDGGNNIFDINVISNDYIFFYGEKFRGDHFANLFPDEDNGWLDFAAFWPLYGLGTQKIELADHFETITDTNYYWLSVECTGAALMSTATPVAGGTSKNTYRETVRFEQQLVPWTHHFTHADLWFWFRLRSSVNPSSSLYPLAISNVVPGGANATFRAEAVSRTYNELTPDRTLEFSINGSSIGSTTWAGRNRTFFNASLTPAQINDGDGVVDFQASIQTSPVDQDIYFDFAEVEYDRYMVAQSNRLTFTETAVGTFAYQITGFSGVTEDVVAYDITNPLQPVQIAGTYTSGTGTFTFQAQNTGTRRIGVFGASYAPSGAVTAYVNTNWSASSNNAKYVIIAPDDSNFITALEPLRTYRASTYGSALIINVRDLYNEFTFGIEQPIAVRQFLKFAYNWQTRPSFVLLVGYGHWNTKGYNTASWYSPTAAGTKNILTPNMVWADPWQGNVDSSSWLAAVSGSDPVPDYFIGRLPAFNTTQITNYINKLIAYESSSVFANWRKNHIFAADNLDIIAGNFWALSDGIANAYVSAGRRLKTYVCSGGASDPAGCFNGSSARTNLINDLNTKGALIANYVGHGSVAQYADEGVLRISDVASLNNAGKLPIFVSMDCLDGYYSFPASTTGASPLQPALTPALVLQQDVGAIAAYSPTGLGVANGHDIMHHGFYDSIMAQNATYLGQAVLASKAELYGTGYHFDLIHSFTIFGDPGLRIAYARDVFLPIILK